MAGLVIVDLVANPPVDESLARSLVASCSAAAGAGGCALGAEQDAQVDVRSRVLVSFSAGYASVHVETTTPLPGGGTPREREVVFRDADPPIERFRAAGLVVADLISGTPPQRDEARTAISAPVPTPPNHRDAAVWSLAWTLSPTTIRPRLGVWLGADVPVPDSRAFVAVSGLYQQSWHRDATGISERRAALCVGAGFAVPIISGSLDFRGRFELELEDLMASIQQPMTGQQDAGGRLLAGVGAGGNVIWPMNDRMGLFVGGRLAWLGSDTTVTVHDKVASAIPAVESSVALGLNARIP